jgi:hypothetical protein
VAENFDTYWKQYKKVPMYCKPMLEWLRDFADDALIGGMPLNDSQKVRLFTAMKNTADACKKCDCPED